MTRRDVRQVTYRRQVNLPWRLIDYFDCPMGFSMKILPDYKGCSTLCKG